MNELFLILSMVPAIEARGASVYFLCSGQMFLIPFTVMLNFLAVMIFVKLLELGKVPNRIESLMERRMEKVYHRVEGWFERYGNITVFLLVALPSTGVGSFTGAFIGRSMGLRKRIFYASILAGIVLSLVISFPLAYLLNALYIAC